MMLAIDAATVPVTYRVRVQSDGEIVAETTSVQLPADAINMARTVRDAFLQAGYADPTVTYWAA